MTTVMPAAVNAEGYSEPELACSKTIKIRDKQQLNRNCERNKTTAAPEKTLLSSNLKRVQRQATL